MSEYEKFINDLKQEGAKAFTARGIKLSPEQSKKLNNFNFQKMSFEQLQQQFNKSKFDAMISGGFFTFF